MSMLRPIAAALLALSMTAPVGTAARAEPLEPDECKALETQKQSLLTAGVKAALIQGPDWVKEHLHNEEEIERIRVYLQVEEKVAFRCRTDGVVVPKPVPPPLPDPKPAVPIIMAEGQKVLAGAVAMSFLPLRKPSAVAAEMMETMAGAQEPAGDADDPEEVTAAAESPGAGPGPSQAVADSDKTAPSENKATR
jgi:hypothetical protein